MRVNYSPLVCVNKYRRILSDHVNKEVEYLYIHYILLRSIDRTIIVLYIGSLYVFVNPSIEQIQPAINPQPARNYASKTTNIHNTAIKPKQFKQTPQKENFTRTLRTRKNHHRLVYLPRPSDRKTAPPQLFQPDKTVHNPKP